MKVNTTYITIGVLVLLIGIGAFNIGKRHGQVTPLETATTTEEVVAGGSTTPVTAGGKPVVSSGVPLVSPNTAGYSTYANSEYSFSVQYPKYAQVRQGFSTFHEIGNNWRLYPGQANQGKDLVEIAVFSTDQGIYSTGKQSYPLYFLAAVRVGVSPNVKACYDLDAATPNQKVTNVTINGVPFKKFSTPTTGGEKYTQVESYRTIRNNNCFAIEQIKTGTGYRDDLLKPGLSDTALSNYYAAGETIIRTFKFTR